MQGADLTSRGKAFQTAGADERKARPAITVFVLKALLRFYERTIIISIIKHNSRCKLLQNPRRGTTSDRNHLILHEQPRIRQKRHYYKTTSN